MTSLANGGAFLLRGITVELEGNEGDIVFTRPIATDGSDDYVVGETDGGGYELRPLVERDREYVRWFPDGDPGLINVDEGVWIAGPQLIRDLGGGDAPTLVRRIRAWAPFEKGFRWTSGTYQDYVDFMQENENLFEVILHKALFHRSRKKGGKVKQVFMLYQAFAVHDTLERALNSALYYSETHEERSLDLQVADAVFSGHVQDAAEFMKMLQILRSRVLAMRMAEQIDNIDATSRPPLKKHLGFHNTGTVTWFNADRGFGFIAPDDGGADVFAHYVAIAKNGYVELEKDQRVVYRAGGVIGSPEVVITEIVDP